MLPQAKSPRDVKPWSWLPGHLVPHLLARARQINTTTEAFTAALTSEDGDEAELSALWLEIFGLVAASSQFWEAREVLRLRGELHEVEKMTFSEEYLETRRILQKAAEAPSPGTVATLRQDTTTFQDTTVGKQAISRDIRIQNSSGMSPH